MGNNQETDGETSTVCCQTFDSVPPHIIFTWSFPTLPLVHEVFETVFFIRLLLLRHFAFSCPGVHLHFLLKSEQHWDRRGRRCACCSKENCLTCQTAKTFQMKSPCLSSLEPKSQVRYLRCTTLSNYNNLALQTINYMLLILAWFWRVERLFYPLIEYKIWSKLVFL